ncbi:MAG: hypothetical protein R6U93_00370 [Dehalococcoidia bacterium]
MKARQIGPDVYRVGAIDWDRRLFGVLMPLPDGTSCNAYLVRDGQKVALIDAVHGNGSQPAGGGAGPGDQQGIPVEEDFKALDNLARAIADKHKERGFA